LTVLWRLAAVAVVLTAVAALALAAVQAVC
jgi:hypothetical protein